MMHTVVLLTGANMGDSRSTLLRAAEMASERIGSRKATSRIYSSPAWGFDAEQEFQNQAMLLLTQLSPEQVIDEVQRMESDLGRRREQEQTERAMTGARYASRKIDIDVMFYDDRIIDSARLTVPHPRIEEREFALRPLCEIMGCYVHPRLGLTLKDIYEELKRRRSADETK